MKTDMKVGLLSAVRKHNRASQERVNVRYDYEDLGEVARALWGSDLFFCGVNMGL